MKKFSKSLPPRFEALVVTLEENKDMPVFTIDELQASLINHEHEISRTNTSLEGALIAQSSISCGRGGGRNKHRGRGRNKHKGRGISSSRGGRSSNPASAPSRGQNQNQNPPIGHRFDK